MTVRDLFVDYFIDEPFDLESYERDCISLLVGEANDRGLEFDGYFKSRFEDEAENPVDFDEDYFDQPERKKLYVYLSALANEEIYQMLREMYEVAQMQPPTKEQLHKNIELLIRRGVRF